MGVIAGTTEDTWRLTTKPLDAPLPGADTEEQTLVDSLGNKDDRFTPTEARLSLPLAIARLPYLERRAVILRLTQNLKQVEIAPEMGCSRMQVSRLLRRAATRLRGILGHELDSRHAA